MRTGGSAAREQMTRECEALSRTTSGFLARLRRAAESPSVAKTWGKTTVPDAHSVRVRKTARSLRSLADACRIETASFVGPPPTTGGPLRLNARPRYLGVRQGGRVWPYAAACRAAIRRFKSGPWLDEVERSETSSVPSGERSDLRGPPSRVRRAANAIADSNPRKRAQRVFPGSNSAVTFLLLSRRCASPGDDDAPDGSGDESGSAEQTAEDRHVVNEVKMPRIG